ncbi:hypothetical protein DY000_02062711 [Brassica cretica]|uniref:Uncharacterized protein n=1 Tax=Brassica cretica TaxID=69181 RepID=A0ABQ7B0X2_BRACR|nr:hypothetical protein DY000_02062711 [Brassica cretica]
MYQWRFRTQSTKKEIDVKFRKEEARRKKGSKQNESKQVSRISKAVPASDANAELLASIQKRQGKNNQTNMSKKFNPNEDAALKSATMRGLNRSPPLSKELMMQQSFVQRGSAQLTKFSDSIAARYASHFSIANQLWFNNKKMGDCEKTERINISWPLTPAGGNLDGHAQASLTANGIRQESLRSNQKEKESLRFHNVESVDLWVKSCVKLKAKIVKRRNQQRQTRKN